MLMGNDCSWQASELFVTLRGNLVFWYGSRDIDPDRYDMNDRRITSNNLDVATGPSERSSLPFIEKQKDHAEAVFGVLFAIKLRVDTKPALPYVQDL